MNAEINAEQNAEATLKRKSASNQRTNQREISGVRQKADTKVEIINQLINSLLFIYA